MSSVSKLLEANKRERNWNVLFNSFSMREQILNGTNYYGYYVWPVNGALTYIDDLVVSDEAGLEIIDSTNIQGVRVLKDLEVRVTGSASGIDFIPFFVAVVKTNKSYGGRPFASIDPEPTEENALRAQEHSSPIIQNSQSVLGSCVFTGMDTHEHVIKCLDCLLGSDDTVVVVFGNLEMFGEIERNSLQPTGWSRVYWAPDEDVTVRVAGTVKGAIAYL